MNNQQWLAVADDFSNAPFESGGWLAALSGLAKSTGSRVGELIGLGSANTVPFNWVTDLGPDWKEDFLASNGGDPAENPFVRAGINIPPLQVRSSEEFITREERRTNRFIVEHTRRFDIPYICLTPLSVDAHGVVGLAVIRSASQGEIKPNQRQVFAALAPHARSAVRTQMVLEHQGAKLVAGAMEALELPAFVCDRSSRVRALTPQAEQLVAKGSQLFLKEGQLRGSTFLETRAISRAIELAATGVTQPAAPKSTTLLLSGCGGAEFDPNPWLLEIIPVPRRDFSFGFEPRVIVVARRQGLSDAQVKAILCSSYRLTDAEVDIALRLAAGQSPAEISNARRSTVGTVRFQIKGVYEKLGVHRASELVVLIGKLR